MQLEFMAVAHIANTVKQAPAHILAMNVWTAAHMHILSMRSMQKIHCIFATGKNANFATPIVNTHAT